MGRQRYRRPVLLLAIGVTLGLGIAAAVAAAAMVAKAPPPRDRAVASLALRVTPSTRTVAPGDSATYSLRVEAGMGWPRGLSGRTRLSVGAGIPRGARVSFMPQSIVVPRGTSNRPSTLTITTRAGTAAGTYRFQIRAQRPHGQGHSTVRLIVSTPPAATAPAAPTAPSATAPAPTVPPAGTPAPSPPVVTAPDAFTISGDLPGLLIPGSEAPLDLSLANHESADLSISGLTVGVAAVSAPHADAQHPCGPADFSVAQFSGTPGFTLPASSTATLGELGFEPAQWPRVTMIDSASNQNGCRSASLHLAFAGTATEGSP